MPTHAYVSCMPFTSCEPQSIDTDGANAVDVQLKSKSFAEESIVSKPPILAFSPETLDDGEKEDGVHSLRVEECGHLKGAPECSSISEKDSLIHASETLLTGDGNAKYSQAPMLSLSCRRESPEVSFDSAAALQDRAASSEEDTSKATCKTADKVWLQEQVIEALIMFIRERGGSMAVAQADEFYDARPDLHMRQAVTKIGGLRCLCGKNRQLLQYRRGRISLRHSNEISRSVPLVHKQPRPHRASTPTTPAVPCLLLGEDDGNKNSEGGRGSDGLELEEAKVSLDPQQCQVDMDRLSWQSLDVDWKRMGLSEEADEQRAVQQRQQQREANMHLHQHLQARRVVEQENEAAAALMETAA